MSGYRIGLIGGCGVIGSAILKGLVANGVPCSDLIASGTRHRANGLSEGIAYTTDNDRLITESDFIVLAVRPQDFRTMSLNVGGRPLLSVMAGVTVAELIQTTKAGFVIRALPNAAAGVGKSFTPYFTNGVVPLAVRATAETICRAIGVCTEVDAEDAIDYFTGLTGSGLGFVAILADAMIEHAVGRGFAAEMVTEAIRVVFEGSGLLIGRGAESPREITEQLKGYRGTTEAALSAMEEAGFRSTIALGLDAAEQRAKSMAR